MTVLPDRLDAAPVGAASVATGSGATRPAGGPVAVLAQRLRAAWPFLTGRPLPAVPGDPGEQAAVLLAGSVAAVADDLRDDRVWLLITAVAAAFPTAEDCLALRRTAELSDVPTTMERLLGIAHRVAVDAGEPDRTIEVLDGGVVVDVDFAARHDLHTGIQRVVRETVPRWHRDHDVVLVGWSDARGAYRRLRPVEAERVLRWGLPGGPAARDEGAGALVVPWHARIVLPEITPPDVCPRLAAVARMSGSRVGAIGYDCIPLVSPDLVDPRLAEDFVRFLTVLKHADVVAAISRSAEAEFGGFADMLPTQGLSGPRVVEVMLPVTDVGAAGAVGAVGAAGAAGARDVRDTGPGCFPAVPVGTGGAAAPTRPAVLCVGSLEPRKNQVSVLMAAEALWREGVSFELRFIGGGGRDPEFSDLSGRLAAAGRPLTVSVGVTDADLLAAYRRARFTVFVSLHEGYGLPVAESLAHGVPVLATAYGSTAEIAGDGGVLLVDPRDPAAVQSGMRRLLSDDDLHARLAHEAAARRPGSWDAYAARLWDELVGSGAGA